MGCRLNPWVGKIPWRRAWQPVQYSCLENPIDSGAWWAAVHRVTKSDMTEMTEHTHAQTENSTKGGRNLRPMIGGG